MPDRRLIDAVAYPMLQRRPGGKRITRTPDSGSDRDCRTRPALSRDTRPTAPAY